MRPRARLGLRLWVWLVGDTEMRTEMRTETRPDVEVVRRERTFTRTLADLAAGGPDGAAPAELSVYTDAAAAPITKRCRRPRRRTM